MNDSPLILLLGAPPRSPERLGDQLAARVDAAAALSLATGWTVVVSGDRRRDEVRAITRALIERGISPAHIVTDETARRTIDSFVAIAHTHPGRIVHVVTNPFHMERALFLARALGVCVVPCPAPSLPPSRRLRVRERVAWLRALYDVLRTRTLPRARRRS